MSAAELQEEGAVPAGGRQHGGLRVQEGVA